MTFQKRNKNSINKRQQSYYILFWNCKAKNEATWRHFSAGIQRRRTDQSAYIYPAVHYRCIFIFSVYTLRDLPRQYSCNNNGAVLLGFIKFTIRSFPECGVCDWEFSCEVQGFPRRGPRRVHGCLETDVILLGLKYLLICNDYTPDSPAALLTAGLPKDSIKWLIYGSGGLTGAVGTVIHRDARWGWLGTGTQSSYFLFLKQPHKQAYLVFYIRG